MGDLFLKLSLREYVFVDHFGFWTPAPVPETANGMGCLTFFRHADGSRRPPPHAWDVIGATPSPFFLLRLELALLAYEGVRRQK